MWGYLAAVVWMPLAWISTGGFDLTPASLSHDPPESVFTMLRNTHRPPFGLRGALRGGHGGGERRVQIAPRRDTGGHRCPSHLDADAPLPPTRALHRDRWWPQPRPRTVDRHSAFRTRPRAVRGLSPSAASESCTRSSRQHNRYLVVHDLSGHAPRRRRRLPARLRVRVVRFQHAKPRLRNRVGRLYPLRWPCRPIHIASRRLLTPCAPACPQNLRRTIPLRTEPAV